MVDISLVHSRYSSNGQREYAWKLHKAAVLRLGNVCINCGEDNILVLQINHLNGNAEKENGIKFYEHILDNIRNTIDLDVRCANCNILYEYERGTRLNWGLING